ncbi:MAG TPA: peptidylprolyl isomerase, partial [Pseudomonas sp.]|nr:peptidylprolyl isomerase [Pseudomonas sp.]
MTTGCGCGGGNGGSGGCGSSAKEPVMAEAVAQASFEEIKAPELIAS